MLVIALHHDSVKYKNYLLTYIYYSLFIAGYLSTAVGISATFNTDHI